MIASFFMIILTLASWRQGEIQTEKMLVTIAALTVMFLATLAFHLVLVNRKRYSKEVRQKATGILLQAFVTLVVTMILMASVAFCVRGYKEAVKSAVRDAIEERSYNK